MVENLAVRTLLRQVEEMNSEHLNIYLRPEFARRLYSLAYIQQDFMFLKHSAQNLLKRLREPQEDGEKAHLEADKDAQWYGLITMYGRCFTKNWDKNERLDIDIFMDNDNLIKIHERIMMLRDKFVAHRDASPFENAVVVVTVKENQNAKPDTYFNIRSARTTPDYEEISSYMPLFNYLEKEVAKLIIAAKSELAQKLNTLDLAYLEQNVIKNLRAGWNDGL